jgi:hypothetical protein
MKKIFTLISIVLCSASFGQSFSMYKMNNTLTSTLNTISNGYELVEVTTVNNQNKARIKIVNNSASTITLSVVRTVIFQNPNLVLDGSTTRPYTYFCFGNTCFPSNISTVTAFDYTILGPSGTTSTPYDNTKDNGQPFEIYMEEAGTLGKYFIGYRVYNVNNPSDEIVFRYIYNDFAGVNENSKTISDVSVYPNPVNNLANISLNLTEEAPVKIQVFNSLGSMVYNGSEQKLSGKNKLTVDCSNYNSGVYFVSINAGGTKITKKLIVNK